MSWLRSTPSNIFFTQQISDISSHNASVAQHLLHDNREISKQTKELLDSQQLKHAEAIAKLRSRNSDEVIRLKQKIQQKDDLVVGMEELATDVASEYSSLKRASNATVLQLTSKADSRLNNLKEAKKRESDLRQSLDSYTDELSDARGEIIRLNKQLAEKDDIISALNDELAAKEAKLFVRCASLFNMLINELTVLSFASRL